MSASSESGTEGVAALGASFLNQTGKVVSIPEGTEVVAVYFSASWCPPCHAFTPVLAAYYRKLKEAGKRFEVVFVSLDRDEQSYRQYQATMPWLAVPFDAPERKSLPSSHRVFSVPTLVFLDAATGDVITKDGRGAVSSDPEGEQFPYREWKGGSWCSVL